MEIPMQIRHASLTPPLTPPLKIPQGEAPHQKSLSRDACTIAPHNNEKFQYDEDMPNFSRMQSPASRNDELFMEAPHNEKFQYDGDMPNFSRMQSPTSRNDELFMEAPHQTSMHGSEYDDARIPRHPDYPHHSAAFSQEDMEAAELRIKNGNLAPSRYEYAQQSSMRHNGEMREEPGSYDESDLNDNRARPNHSFASFVSPDRLGHEDNASIQDAPPSWRDKIKNFVPSFMQRRSAQNDDAASIQSDSSSKSSKIINFFKGLMPEPSSYNGEADNNWARPELAQ